MRGWYTQIAELKEENEKLRAEVKQLRAEITAWDELEGIKFLREEQARLKAEVEEVRSAGKFCFEEALTLMEKAQAETATLRNMVKSYRAKLLKLGVDPDAA